MRRSCFRHHKRARIGGIPLIFGSSTVTRIKSESTRIESDAARDEADMSDAPPRQASEHAITRLRLPSEVARELAPYRRRRGGGASGGGRSGGSSGKKGLLSDAELAGIEQTYAEGITAVQVVDIFTSRGVRFSEASFRKYVQQGLLPRSRRVGRKGKHRGSMGVYPAKTVRRINTIKRLMGEGHTIEEIQEQFLRYADALEVLEEGFSELFSRLEEEVAGPRFDIQSRRSMTRELREARESADELLGRLDELTRRAAQPRGDEYRNTGAAGSAEDLL
jgi:DNA-binding transcriptional MerR regulator